MAHETHKVTKPDAHLSNMIFHSQKAGLMSLCKQFEIREIFVFVSNLHNNHAYEALLEVELPSFRSAIHTLGHIMNLAEEETIIVL